MKNKNYDIITEKDEFIRPEPAVYDEEWSFLTENIELILKNSLRILKNEKYFFTKIRCAFIGSNVTGVKPISAGILIKLWGKGSFLEKCEICGSKVYIVNASGSALSGIHQCNGICVKCGKLKINRNSNFSKILQPAINILNEVPNNKII